MDYTEVSTYGQMCCGTEQPAVHSQGKEKKKLLCTVLSSYRMHYVSLLFSDFFMFT